MAQNESGDMTCTYAGEVRNRVVKSLGQELLSDRHVVEQRCWGQSTFLQQVTLELVDDFRPGGVRDRLLGLHNAFLAKHGQQSIQGFRIASTDPLLPLANPQKSIHNVAVQMPGIAMCFCFSQPAEIGNHQELLSDRVLCIALLGNSGRIGIKVFAQRPLPHSFNRAWESEELVYHSPRVPSRRPRTMPRRSKNASKPINKARTPTRGIVREAA